VGRFFVVNRWLFSTRPPSILNGNNAKQQQLTMNDKFFESAKIYIKYLAGAALVAIAIFVIGESFARGMSIVWLFRIGAGATLLFGLTNWNRPIVPRLLEGPPHKYYPVYRYDNTPARLIQAGNRMICPSEYVNDAQGVEVTQPAIEIEFRRTTYNRTFDTFDVYLKLKFDLHPQQAIGFGALWFVTNYTEGMRSEIETVLSDLVIQTMRDIEGFSVAIERATEEAIKEMVMAEFEPWADRGLVINPSASFVNVLVAEKVLNSRVEARAELSILQIIRDVAQEMDIPVNELMIQRTLEKLPQARTKQDIGAIAEVLRAVHQDAVASTRPESVPTSEQVEDDYEMDIRVDPNRRQSHPQLEDSHPRSFVEGEYEFTDDNDPDAEDTGTTRHISPF
jgi:hypothetical protein